MVLRPFLFLVFLEFEVPAFGVLLDFWVDKIGLGEAGSVDVFVGRHNTYFGHVEDKCEVTVQGVESQHRRSQEDDGVLCCWGPPACTFIKSLQLCQWSHCIIPPMEECSSS